MIAIIIAIAIINNGHYLPGAWDWEGGGQIFPDYCLASCNLCSTVGSDTCLCLSCFVHFGQLEETVRVRLESRLNVCALTLYDATCNAEAKTTA